MAIQKCDVLLEQYRTHAHHRYYHRHRRRDRIESIDIDYDVLNKHRIRNNNENNHNRSNQNNYSDRTEIDCDDNNAYDGLEAITATNLKYCFKSKRRKLIQSNRNEIDWCHHRSIRSISRCNRNDSALIICMLQLFLISPPWPLARQTSIVIHSYEISSSNASLRFVETKDSNQIDFNCTENSQNLIKINNKNTSDDSITSLKRDFNSSHITDIDSNSNQVNHQTNIEAFPATTSNTIVFEEEKRKKEIIQNLRTTRTSLTNIKTYRNEMVGTENPSDRNKHFNRSNNNNFSIVLKNRTTTTTTIVDGHDSNETNGLNALLSDCVCCFMFTENQYDQQHQQQQANSDKNSKNTSSAIMIDNKQSKNFIINMDDARARNLINLLKNSTSPNRSASASTSGSAWIPLGSTNPTPVIAKQSNKPASEITLNEKQSPLLLLSLLLLSSKNTPLSDQIDCSTFFNRTKNYDDVVNNRSSSSSSKATRTMTVPILERNVYNHLNSNHCDLFLCQNLIQSSRPMNVGSNQSYNYLGNKDHHQHHLHRNDSLSLMAIDEDKKASRIISTLNQTKILTNLESDLMLADQSSMNLSSIDPHTSNGTLSNQIDQKQSFIYRYYSQRRENDLKTLLARYPSLRLPPPPPEFIDDFDPGITEVSTVAGSDVEIPCNTTWIEDEVSLVLWFRGDTGVPIYRVDARNVPLAKAIHTSNGDEAKRKRLYFDVNRQPPVLHIKPVLSSDAAEYRCRVDFRQSRTQNVIVLLNVTVPPKELLIMDVEGQKLEGVIGPFDEKSNVVLICEAEGGKPSPSVNWFRAGRLIDSTYTTGPHGLVRNELNLRNLNRSDFMSILTCRASNNNVTEPISSTVILDMNLRPINVKIVSKSHLIKSSFSSASSSSTNAKELDSKLPFVLSAGSKAEFQCESVGSRPAAQISWWLGSERFSTNIHDNINDDGNATISTIVFVPNIEDDGKLLTCRADNLPMPHTALKDERLLNILFAPQIRISFGANIQTDSIREGSDVYMECQVKANPQVKEVVWIHDGRPIHSFMATGNVEDSEKGVDSDLNQYRSVLNQRYRYDHHYQQQQGPNHHGSTIIMTNQSLVIQKVHRSHRGRYQCVALNDQGETISDPLYLQVDFVPGCKANQKHQYGVSKNEQIRIRCEVDAEPTDDLTFRWTLNTSGTETAIEWPSFTIVNKTISIATYRPESSLDYGTLACSAQNKIGIQERPCVYSVVPAGRPDGVRGCAITNHSMNTLLIECLPGDDGGLRQHFNLEVYYGPNESRSSMKVLSEASAQSKSFSSSSSSSIVFDNQGVSAIQHHQQLRLHSNHSSSQPNFLVSSLTPGTTYTLNVYAANAKGRSQTVSLSAMTLASPEKHVARGSFEQIVVHPILAILIGIVATVVIVVIILILSIRSRIHSNLNTDLYYRRHNLDNSAEKIRGNRKHSDGPSSSSSSKKTSTSSSSSMKKNAKNNKKSKSIDADKNAEKLIEGQQLAGTVNTNSNNKNRPITSSSSSSTSSPSTKTTMMMTMIAEEESLDDGTKLIHDMHPTNGALVDIHDANELNNTLSNDSIILKQHHGTISTNNEIDHLRFHQLHPTAARASITDHESSLAQTLTKCSENTIGLKSASKPLRQDVTGSIKLALKAPQSNPTLMALSLSSLSSSSSQHSSPPPPHPSSSSSSAIIKNSKPSSITDCDMNATSHLGIIDPNVLCINDSIDLAKTQDHVVLQEMTSSNYDRASIDSQISQLKHPQQRQQLYHNSSRRLYTISPTSSVSTDNPSIHHQNFYPNSGCSEINSSPNRSSLSSSSPPPVMVQHFLPQQTSQHQALYQNRQSMRTTMKSPTSSSSLSSPNHHNQYLMARYNSKSTTTTTIATATSSVQYAHQYHPYMDADYIEGQFDPNLSFYLSPKQFLSPTTIDSYTSSIVSPTLELSASLYDQNRVTSSFGETHTMGNLDFHLAPNNTLTSTLFNELKTDVSKQQMNLDFRAEPQTNYSKPVFNYSETDKEIELGSNVIGGDIQNEDVSKSLLEQPHHQQQQQLKRTKLDMLAKHCNVSLLRKNSRQEKIDDSGNDVHGQAEGYLNGSIDRKASLTKLTNQSVADQSTPSHMRLDPMNIQSKDNKLHRNGTAV